jgi:Tol biopolymer transport system component
MRRALTQLTFALSAGVVGVLALLPSQAVATFHGRNGLIAWSTDVSDGKAGGAFAITILPVGRGRRHVIRHCSNVDVYGNPIYCQQWYRVSYSPDGRHLMWDLQARSGNYVVVLAGADGSAPHTIAQSSTLSDSEPSFSPNGQRIVYVSGPTGAEGQIVTSNLAGGAVRVLTPTVTGFDPVWAPNGNTIVFVHGVDIWSVGVNGLGAHRLIRNGQDPDFSPNGRKIVYLNNGGFTETFGTIYTAHADGSHQRRFPIVGHCCMNVQRVVFSPDGKQLAFGVLSPAATESLELRTVSINGGHPKLIASKFTNFNGGFTNSLSWRPR